MKKKKGSKLSLQSTKEDTKPKQEFSGSAAKGKKLHDPVKTSHPEAEFGGGKYSK